MSQILPETVLERMQIMLKEVRLASLKLDDSPVNVDDYIVFRKFLNITEEKMGEYSNRFNDIKDFKMLIETHEFKMNDIMIN